MEDLNTYTQEFPLDGNTVRLAFAPDGRTCLQTLTTEVRTSGETQTYWRRSRAFFPDIELRERIAELTAEQGRLFAENEELRTAIANKAANQ